MSTAPDDLDVPAVIRREPAEAHVMAIWLRKEGNRLARVGAHAPEPRTVEHAT